VCFTGILKSIAEWDPIIKVGVIRLVFRRFPPPFFSSFAMLQTTKIWRVFLEGLFSFTRNPLCTYYVDVDLRKMWSFQRPLFPLLFDINNYDNTSSAGNLISNRDNPTPNPFSLSLSLSLSLSRFLSAMRNS
jgi:hypothetical protein